MKYLIGFFVIVNGISVKGQSECDSIIHTFESYRSLLENKEYEEAYKYLLDSFLLYLPKEQLMQQFTELNNNPNIEYKLYDMQINFISEIIEDNHHRKYAFVKHFSYFDYAFKSLATEEYRERIKNQFKNTYEKNYSFSEKDQKITLLRNEELIAVKKNGEWRFILYQDRLNPYMNIWIPQETFAGLLAKREGKNCMK